MLFRSHNHVGNTRFFSYQEYTRTGETIETGTDASPWGIGSYLSIQGSIVQHFSDVVTEDDLSILKIERGSSDGQQVLEALALLVALKLWSEHVINRNVSLHVKGDNVGALILLLKMRPKTASLALIAREMALCVATSAFPPRTLHTPGVAHTKWRTCSVEWHSTSPFRKLQKLTPPFATPDA